MKSSPLTVASLALNLALTASLLWALYRERTPATREPTHATIPQPAAPPPAPPTPLIVSPHAAPPKPFHWSQVESPDYLRYIANLRAIGCPEQTVRDIIVADINQLFAPRYAALSKGAPELAWWGRYDSRKPLPADLNAQLLALDFERTDLLQRLLGPRAVAEHTFADTSVATVREQAKLAFLPEAKRSAVRQLLSRYQTLMESGAAQWKGLPSDRRDDLEKQLRDARTTELAALLSPDELAEFQVRDSLTSDLVREEYGRADLTETEFRKLYELRRDFEQHHPEATRDDWQRLNDTFANALGPDRFAELQRQNDSMWRALQSIAGDRALTPDAMQNAYAIKQDYARRMADAVGQMFADPNQNPQPLRDLANEMDTRLANVLGPDAVKHLDRLGALPRLVIQDDGQRKTYSFSRGAFAD